MARVWFVRRRGGQWVAPGGRPAFEMPLAEAIFPLDLGPHRLVIDDPPVPLPDLPPEDAAGLHKILVEVEPKDLTTLEFSGYTAGVYDSPLSPREGARRLTALRGRGARVPA
jgi:hypothetical protein